MLIYTAVASLTPLHQRRGGSPPDMLSGGGRQILASYTAFSYQGTFSDVACRLIDTLPHRSPAVVRESETFNFRVTFTFCSRPVVALHRIHICRCAYERGEHTPTCRCNWRLFDALQVDVYVGDLTTALHLALIAQYVLSKS